MKKIIFIFILILAGCKTSAVKLPEDDLKPFDKPRQSIREFFIEDMVKIDDDLSKVPDKQVVILLNQPVSFRDFFQILIGQGINIVADFDQEKMISVPRFEGDIKTLLRSIQITHGLFITYDDGVLVLREKSPCYVRVLMPGMQDSMIKLIESFGIEKTHYDSLSSRVVFLSDYFTYRKIKSYFENNPYLSLVVFDVMILENEESSDYKNGIDWHQLALNLSELSTDPFSASLEGETASDSFSLKLAGPKFSLDQVFYSLSQHKKFKVLQSARISSLNGSDCELNVTDEIPYVEKIELSALSDVSATTVKGYEFGTESSGLILKITPAISGDVISLKFQADITSLVGYLEVGDSDNRVQRPIITLRKIQNEMLLNPGETFLIGGLRYNKGSLESSGPNFADGYRADESRAFSVSVLIRSELLRYVFI